MDPLATEPARAVDLEPVGRRLSIVPSDGPAGRSLVAVIAILAFLAALAAGTAAIVAGSSAGWREDLAREATIQVMPSAGRVIEADVERAAALARSTPGIRNARPLARVDAERLLEPWLGTGLDLSDLPVPRLVALELEPGSRAALNVLSGRLKSEIPRATLDDHVAWRSRLSLAANTVVALAILTVVLVLTASAGAIAFATRSAITGHRDVVEVLHFVGADDRFIAGTFARRFARLGFAGGLVGACLATLLLTVFSALSGSVFSDDFAGEDTALIGSLVLGWAPYAAIACVALADGVVAGLVTAAAVKRFLKDAY